MTGVQRLTEFGDTIFATISALASQHGAVNLGQGFPDASGPPRMLEIAQQEIAAGNNQYSPRRGLPVLREAIAHQRERDYSMTFDPETEILVTVGATEALVASVLGLVEPGQEVIVFEPYYDAYAAAVALAGARRVAVGLRAVDKTWELDLDAFRAAITDNTAMVIINNPHNPTGSVFDLAEFARICVEHDLTVLADEAYEYQVFDDHQHVPVATLPGMATRTITVGSAAKSFNVTGWKTGWALARPDVIDAITRAKQYLSYVGVTPVQPAIAHALVHERDWVHSMVADLQDRRDYLIAELASAGWDVSSSAGTYFVIANLPTPTARHLCLHMPERYGVAAIPVDVFTDEPEPWRRSVRFTFCKDWDTLRAGMDRIKQVL